MTDKPDPLDDEDAWARSFQEKPALMRSVAREALGGETRPLEELLTTRQFREISLDPPG
jgi:plasmid stability protein